MNVYLSRLMPRWLTRVCWPDGRFGLFARTFLLLATVLIIVQHDGVDTLAAVGLLYVVGSVSIQVLTWLTGLPGGLGTGPAGPTAAR
jgi:hypothetical protein